VAVTPARWTGAPAPSSLSADSPAPTAPPPSTTPLRVPHLASDLDISSFVLLVYMAAVVAPASRHGMMLMVCAVRTLLLQRRS
jgi:hypothetical protein